MKYTLAAIGLKRTRAGFLPKMRAADIQRVEANIARFPLQSLADLFGVSRDHLSHWIRRQGTTRPVETRGRKKGCPPSKPVYRDESELERMIALAFREIDARRQG